MRPHPVEVLQVTSGAELELVRRAGNALTNVATASSAIIRALREGSLVRAADRQALRDHLTFLRREEVANYLARLGMRNMRHLFELYDMAEQHSGNPAKYADGMSIVQQTSALLAENLYQLQRELR